MKKAVIVYHKVDYDGLFSCSIVNKWLRENPYISWEYVGYDYSDPNIPDYSEWKDYFDTLIMVDVSFPPEDMVRLKKEMREFIYEDHHIVSIDNSKKYGYDDLEGIRDINNSAAYNTWLDLFTNKKVPLIIKFISDLDIWNKKDYSWEDILVPFNYSLNSKYGLNITSINFKLDKLINMNLEDLTKNFIETGLEIKKYVDRKQESEVKKYSFEVKVDDKYTARAIIETNFSATIFNYFYESYDFFIIANRVDDSRYKISIYGKNENDIDFSCGEYCAKFGGGGHKTAASCIVGLDKFIELITNKKF